MISKVCRKHVRNSGFCELTGVPALPLTGLPAAMGQYDDFLSSVPSTTIANQFSRAVALSGVQMMNTQLNSDGGEWPI